MRTNSENGQRVHSPSIKHLLNISKLGCLLSMHLFLWVWNFVLLNKTVHKFVKHEPCSYRCVNNRQKPPFIVDPIFKDCLNVFLQYTFTSFTSKTKSCTSLLFRFYRGLKECFCRIFQYFHLRWAKFVHCRAKSCFKTCGGQNLYIFMHTEFWKDNDQI